MGMSEQRLSNTSGRLAWALSCALAVVSCGGCTGNSQDSGVNKTYLSVDASDADGDALQYQWRVTGGSIDNRNASSTVWTLPASRGIHFAYVTVSDGRGGYVEQQYAVNADRLGPAAAGAHADRPRRARGDRRRRRDRPAALRLAPTTPDSSRPPAAPAQARTVFLPDVQVQLFEQGTGALVFGGTTDLGGELDLPKLVAGTTYTVRCTAQNGTPLQDCRDFVADDQATVRSHRARR